MLRKWKVTRTGFKEGLSRARPDVVVGAHGRRRFHTKPDERCSLAALTGLIGHRTTSTEEARGGVSAQARQSGESPGRAVTASITTRICRY